MLANLQNSGLRMEVIDRGFNMATSNNSKSGVLKALKLLNVRLANVRLPNRTGILKDRSDQEFKGSRQSLLALTPNRASDSLHYLDPARSFCSLDIGVCVEADGRVIVNT